MYIGIGGLILIILLIFLIRPFGYAPTRGHYYGGGGLVTLLIILLILAALGVI